MLKFMTKRRAITVGLSLFLAVVLVLSGITVAEKLTPTAKSSQDSVLRVSLGQKVITIKTAEASGAADFTCLGVNDNVIFQTALNALPVAGGRLDVLGGHYVWAAGANVTRTIPNVTINGVGASTNITGNGVTPLFIAGGNNWVFSNIRTDAGGISVGTTTGWSWENVTVNATYYAYRTASTTTGTSWNIPTGRVSNLVFAAPNSSTFAKSQCDVLLTNTGDGATIQTYLGTNNPGTVTFMPGTYVISSGQELSITPAAFTNSLVIHAEGAIFNYPAGAGSVVTINSNFLLSDGIWEKRTVKWYGGTFYGNATALSAIRLNDCSGCVVDSAHIFDFTAVGDTNNGGILLYGSAGGFTESNVLSNNIMRNVSRGITLRNDSGAGYSFGNNHFLDNHIEATGALSAVGFRVPSNSSQLYRCQFDRNTIFLTQNSSCGMMLGGVVDFQGTTIIALGVELQSAPTGCQGVYLPTVTVAANFIDPLFSPIGTFGGGEFANGSTTNYRVTGAGYQNHGAGTLLAGTTSTVVTHYLRTTPSVGQVMVSPTSILGNAAYLYAGNPSSSDFTVYANADPTTANVTFAWSVN
jgi:hypothetical protein